MPNNSATLFCSRSVSGWSSRRAVAIVSSVVAALARVDVLVSWNFRHIVNLNRIRLFNGVSL